MAVLLLAAAALALMVWFQLRHVRRVRLERRAAATQVEALLADPVTMQDGIGYPSVRGRYAGRDVKIELVVDTLTMRRLPRLWLVVTVQRPLGLAVPVDMLLRPSSTDMVSPGARFPYEHARFAAWPEHIRVATPERAPLPALDDVDALTAFLHEPASKCAVLAPRGVRLVHELARGEASSYRVVRRPSFVFELDGARVRRLLDSAMAIADGVERVESRVAVVA